MTMPSSLRIDQTGLSAGVAGRAREDGLDTGALVTLTDTAPLSTTKFELLSVPTADDEAEDSLVVTGARTATFGPKAGVYGTYRIRLTQNANLATERVEIRTFAILTPNLGLRIPAWNEDADDEANLANDGAGPVADCEHSIVSAPYPSGEPRGWFPALEKLIKSVDDMAGGGGAILWAWNGEDDSQWSEGLILSGFTASTPSVSVVDRDEGKRLRFLVHADDDTTPKVGRCIWPVIDPALAVALAALAPLRFVIGYTLMDIARDFGGGLQGWAGAEFLSNGVDAVSGHYGHVWTAAADSNNNWGFRVENGTPTDATGQSTGVHVFADGTAQHVGLKIEHEIRAIKTPGSAPKFWMLTTMWGPDNNPRSIVQKQDDASWNYGAYAAGWNGEILTGIGVGYHAGGGHTFVNSFFELSEFYVRKCTEDQ